jgi:hypothetical protein
MNDKSIATNKSRIEMNTSKEADLTSVNELYSKLENVLQKKKSSKAASRPLIKYTNINSQRENKHSSTSVPSTTREKSKSSVKDKSAEKKIAAITEANKKGNKSDEIFTNLHVRMRNFEEQKKKKISENQMKKHYDIIKSCVGTPKINPKSRRLCSEDDFFKRQNKFEESKETKNKTLKVKMDEKRLSEVKKDNKKLDKSKIEERVNSMLKWDNERKEKIYKKFKAEENKYMVDCTFKPEINRFSRKVVSKYLHKSETSDKARRDKSSDNNLVNTSYSRLQNNNSYISSVQSEEMLSSSLRVIKLKNKEIKTTRKDEEIIEQLLKERFKILKMKYNENKN